MKLRYANKAFSILILILSFTVSGIAQQKSESDDFSYALKLYNEKFYDLAAQQFSRFENNYPSSDKRPEAGYYAGMSLFQLNEFDAARVEFQAVAVDYPDNNRSADSWFMVGECYDRTKQPAEAAKAYEMVKILHPEHQLAPESILRAGKIYQSLGTYEKADQSYNLIQNRYLESNFYFPAVLAQGIMNIERGNYAAAGEKLRKVMESAKDDALRAEAYFNLAEMNRKQGFLNKAEENYQQVIQKFSKSDFYAQASLAYSSILIQRNDYSGARNVLNNARKVSAPSELKRRMAERLGDAYYMSDQYALAQKQYAESAAEPKDPAYVIRKLKAALAWNMQNNPEKAAAELKETVMDTSNFRRQGYTAARSFYFDRMLESHRISQGIEQLYILKKTGRFDETDKKILIGFLKQAENWPAVIKEAENSVYGEAKSSDRDDNLLDIALANEKLGNYSESARYYRKLINEYAASELRPVAIDRLAVLESYHLVDQSSGLNQLTLLIGDIVNKENSGRLQFKLGKVYFENLKEYGNALSQFEEAVKAPENSDIIADLYYYIGLCYEKLAGRPGVPAAEKKTNLENAKKNLGLAMENIATASKPDQVASEFVRVGIRNDNPPAGKQTGYYQMLISKYPSSANREDWIATLAGLLAQNDSSLAAADAEYKILVEQYRGSEHYPEYLAQRAAIAQKQGRKEAADMYRTIAADYPASPPAASALYNLGLIAESGQNYSDANQFFDKLISEYYYTDLAEQALLRRADTYLLSGQYADAITAYESQLSQLPPDDVVLNREFVPRYQIALFYKIGKAYYSQKNWGTAQKYLTSYISADPNGSFAEDANFTLGDIYLELGDPVSAVAGFEKIGAQDDQLYLKARRKIADIYFDTDKYNLASKAYFDLAKGFKEEDKVAEIRARGIIALIRGGKRQEAENLISDYRKKYDKERENLAAFQLELGKYYRINSNLNQAVKYFNNVLKDYSKSSWADDAEYQLALTNITLNKQEEALDILTGFAKKYPESENLGMVYNTLGGIYFRSEKYESAMTSFKRALEKTTDRKQRQQVMSNLIKAYTFVNFWDAALALSREYIDTYPDADDVIDKKILIGRAYVALNQVDRAVEILRETRLIADSEKEPEIQFYIGDAYFRSGEYENAIAEFVKIPFLSRKTKLQWEASALYYSGQAYEKLGRVGEAIRMYEEIVKRPGIDLVLKKDAQKRIDQIKN